MTPEQTGPPLFETLQAYRMAARSIARDEGLGAARYQALVRLLEQGQREAGDSWLALAIQNVISAESRELLEHGRTPKAPAPSWGGDPVTRALWSLRRRGLTRCVECRRSLPEPETLARWEDADRLMWAEAMRLEQAGGDAP